MMNALEAAGAEFIAAFGGVGEGGQRHDLARHLRRQEWDSAITCRPI